MKLIELSDYTVVPDRAGNGLNGFNFSLSSGDFCVIEPDSRDDGRLFLKALATLAQPVKGVYNFMGDTLDFSDYRALLPYKKRIGYFASDAAMVSNMSISENLLLMRYYYENSLQLSLDERASTLCRLFEIEDTLQARPGELSPSALRLAIVTRELTKSPDILFFEYPEDYVGQAYLRIFMDILKEMPISKMGIAFLSEERHFIETFSNRKVILSAGKLTAD